MKSFLHLVECVCVGGLRELLLHKVPFVYYKAFYTYKVSLLFLLLVQDLALRNIRVDIYDWIRMMHDR